MKNLLVIFIALISFEYCFSQENVIAVHPIIGDTIDLHEKLDYLLFSELPNSGFNYAQIYSISGAYFLHSFYKSDTFIVTVDTSALNEYYIQIEKLTAYKSREASADTLNNLDNIRLLNNPANDKKGTNNVLITPETRKKIGYESSRYRELNNSANEQGLSGQERKDYINSGGYGEIKFKKKR